MRRPTCRGGWLCPPKPRAPRRAGLVCPAGKNVSFAAGHMGSALQVISQGAMPTSPRRHWRGTAALQGSLWEGAVGAADWGRENAAFCLSLCQHFALPPPSQREARGRTDCRVASLLAMTALRAVAKPCSIKKNRPRAVLFCLFRADRSGIRCRYRSRPGCSNSLSASQTRPRSHLPAD